jgi:HK97 gp10 family phage protein
MATKVERRQQLLRKLAALPPAARSAMKPALAQSADEMQGMMKRLAPVGPVSGHNKARGLQPGALRDSIVQTWGGGKERYSSVAGGAGADGDPDLTVTLSAGNSKVRYAHLVEFGTAPHENGGKFKGSQHPGTAAQPFFYPSYRALKKRAKNRMSRAAKKAAQRVAAGE